MTVLNIWPVAVVQYSVLIQKCTRTEIDQFNLTARKMMITYLALHAKAIVHKMYIKWGKSGYSLKSLWKCIDVEKKKLDSVFEKQQTGLAMLYAYNEVKSPNE